MIMYSSVATIANLVTFEGQGTNYAQEDTLIGHKIKHEKLNRELYEKIKTQSCLEQLNFS